VNAACRFERRRTVEHRTPLYTYELPGVSMEKANQKEAGLWGVSC
jgi:hypothetical protein